MGIATSYTGIGEAGAPLAIFGSVLLLGLIVWKGLRQRRERRRWRRAPGKIAPGFAGGSRPLYAEAGDPEAAFGFVYVSQEGLPRELSPGERDYLTTRFDPGDGARPYIKAAFESRNGWGSVAGFLARDKVPAGIRVSAVNPAYDRDVRALARLPIERLGSFENTKKALLENERMRDAVAKKGLE